MGNYIIQVNCWLERTLRYSVLQLLDRCQDLVTVVQNIHQNSPPSPLSSLVPWRHSTSQHLLCTLPCILWSACVWTDGRMYSCALRYAGCYSAHAAAKEVLSRLVKLSIPPECSLVKLSIPPECRLVKLSMPPECRLVKLSIPPECRLVKLSI